MATDEYCDGQLEFIKRTGIAPGSIVLLTDNRRKLSERQVEELGWTGIKYVSEYVNDGVEREVYFIDKQSGVYVNGIWYPYFVVKIVHPGATIKGLTRYFWDWMNRNNITKKHLGFISQLARIYPYNFQDVFEILTTD